MAKIKRHNKDEANGQSAMEKRMRNYDKWRDRTDMDRFIILVYMTAAEKRAAAKRFLGDENADYVDGDTVEVFPRG